MSKALVIKQGDFSTNKLTTVTIYNNIPCTGITLDESSATVSTTLTLTATVTPNDTTDTVLWTSSDTNVATVSGGVVTAVANGTATITATCGAYSATCAVSVSLPIVAAKPGLIMIQVENSTTLRDRAGVSYVTGRYASVGGASGSYIAAWQPNVSGTVFESLYPYKIPAGATTINVSMSSDISAIIAFFNSEQHGRVYTDYENTALCLDGETLAGGTPWSVSSKIWGDRTIPVSSVSGVDSFVLGLSFEDQTAYDNFDTSDPGITITFGFDPVS